MKTLLLLIQLFAFEINVDPACVKVSAESYSATILVEAQCTAKVAYYLPKGSLEDADIAEERKYWIDERIAGVCPDPNKYGSREINRGHLRALMLTPKEFAKEVNYAANLIPVFRAANLEMLRVDRQIRKLNADTSMFVEIYMGWDSFPRLLPETNTDIPDTITYRVRDVKASKILFEKSIENK